MGSLARLKGAFQKIKKSTNITEELEIDGLKLSVGLISREEEIKALSWADEQGQGIQVNQMYQDLARLSYAVKGVDGEMLPELIEDDDDRDEQGRPSKQQRHLVVREMLLDLPGPIIDALSQKYNKIRIDLRGKLGIQVVSLDNILEQLAEARKAIPSNEMLEQFANEDAAMAAEQQIAEAANGAEV